MREMIVRGHVDHDCLIIKDSNIINMYSVIDVLLGQPSLHRHLLRYYTARPTLADIHDTPPSA